MLRPIRNYRPDTPGRYPNSEYQLRHLWRNRHANGLAPAFAQVGARVLFDPDRLEALLLEQSRSAA
ncbi:MAG: hypothetical protein MUC71_03230 [Steroidobacteraceae bacterium]|jgi:hypothetical protein|nr:hypothetical protein [Steroidobacteraceae bacterium]